MSVAAYLRKSGVPKQYCDISLDDFAYIANFNAERHAAFTKFLAERAEQVTTGKSIIFSGSSGTGKTKAASYVTRVMAEKFNGVCAFLDMDDIYELISNSWKTEEAKEARDRKLFNSDLLIMDNIPHSLNKSRDIREVMPLIIRKREDNGLKTIITTAIPQNKWVHTFGEDAVSLFSRYFTEIPLPELKRN